MDKSKASEPLPNSAGAQEHSSQSSHRSWLLIAAGVVAVGAAATAAAVWVSLGRPQASEATRRAELLSKIVEALKAKVVVAGGSGDFRFEYSIPLDLALVRAALIKRLRARDRVLQRDFDRAAAASLGAGRLGLPLLGGSWGGLGVRRAGGGGGERRGRRLTFCFPGTRTSSLLLPGRNAGTLCPGVAPRSARRAPPSTADVLHDAAFFARCASAAYGALFLTALGLEPPHRSDAEAILAHCCDGGGDGGEIVESKMDVSDSEGEDALACPCSLRLSLLPSCVTSFIASPTHRLTLSCLPHADFCLRAPSRRALVVAIRGTASLSEVVTDLTAAAEVFSEAREEEEENGGGRSGLTPVAHGCFLRASRWLLRRLLVGDGGGGGRVGGGKEGGEDQDEEEGGEQALRGCLSPAAAPELWKGDGEARIVVTGHSLGGSAAQILSALLARAMRRHAERRNAEAEAGALGPTLHAPPVHCFAFGPSPAVALCRGEA